MGIKRVLEPEVMDSSEEAADYDAMDHLEVNRVFVDDLLGVIDSSKFKVQCSQLGEPTTLNLNVLDLGTGTALIPIELCKRFAGCRVVAADAAVSMLEVARYNVEVNSLAGRIE